MKVPDIDYQAEIKKCKTLDDVVGKNGLMKKLLKDVMQQLLEAEMDEHLGREKYERNEDESDSKNYRNGHSKKSVNTIYGEVPIDMPRDRNSEFNPHAIGKYETDCNELDKKIIGLYARGMSTRDIQSELEKLYGIDVSPSMISKITDKVMGAAVKNGRTECLILYIQ